MSFDNSISCSWWLARGDVFFICLLDTIDGWLTNLSDSLWAKSDKRCDESWSKARFLNS